MESKHSTYRKISNIRSLRTVRFALAPAICLAVIGFLVLMINTTAARAAVGLPSLNAIGGVDQALASLEQAGVDTSNIDTSDLDRLDDMVNNYGITTINQFNTLSTQIGGLNPQNFSDVMDISQQLGANTPEQFQDMVNTIQNSNLAGDLNGLLGTVQGMGAGSLTDLESLAATVENLEITDLPGLGQLTQQFNIDMNNLGDLSLVIGGKDFTDLGALSDIAGKIGVGSLDELKELTDNLQLNNMMDLGGASALIDQFNLGSFDQFSEVSEIFSGGNIGDLEGLNKLVENLGVSNVDGLRDIVDTITSNGITDVQGLSELADQLGIGGISGAGGLTALAEQIGGMDVTDLGGLTQIAEKLGVSNLGEIGNLASQLGDLDFADMGNIGNVIDRLGITGLDQFEDLTEALDIDNLQSLAGLDQLMDNFNIVSIDDLSDLTDRLQDLDIANIDLTSLNNIADNLGLNYNELDQLLNDLGDMEFTDFESLSGLVDELDLGSFADFEQLDDFLDQYGIEDLAGLTEIVDGLNIDNFTDLDQLGGMLEDMGLDSLAGVSDLLESAGLDSLQDLADIDLTDVDDLSELAGALGVEDYNPWGGLDRTTDLAPVAAGGPCPGAPCVGCLDSDCESAKDLISDRHQDEIPEMRQTVTTAFQEHRDWISDLFMIDRFINALKNMAHQLSASGWQQIAAYGKLFDAKAQLESQRLQDELHFEALRAYQPSESFCTFGTAVRSLAHNESIAKTTTLALNQRQMARHLGRQFVGGAETANEDKKNRWQNFRRFYCDPQDNNWAAGQADSGLTAVCDANANAENRTNIDIDYTRAVENKRTYNLSGAAWIGSEGEIDLLALGNNLYGHDILTRNISEAGLRSETLARRYMGLRAITAKRSVAENSFNAIIGMKSLGSTALTTTTAETNLYLGRILTDLGIPANEINDYLGNATANDNSAGHASYYATLEILAKKIFQNTNFYAGLYDTPANVKRKSAALKAIELMLDRAIFESQLRQEMAMSVLLSSRLEKYIEETKE